MTLSGVVSTCHNCQVSLAHRPGCAAPKSRTNLVASRRGCLRLFHQTTSWDRFWVPDPTLAEFYQNRTLRKIVAAVLPQPAVSRRKTTYCAASFRHEGARQHTGPRKAVGLAKPSVLEYRSIMRPQIRELFEPYLGRNFAASPGQRVAT